LPNLRAAVQWSHPLLCSTAWGKRTKTVIEDFYALVLLFLRVLCFHRFTVPRGSGGGFWGENEEPRCHTFERPILQVWPRSLDCTAVLGMSKWSFAACFPNFFHDDAKNDYIADFFIILG
jgi:hypothetical protein